MKKNIHRIIHLSLKLLFLMGLIYGLTIFFAGTHNIDIAHNGMLLNEKYNMSFKDINSNEELWSYTTAYITGFKQLRKGIFLSLYCSFAIGVLFIENVQRTR